MRSIWVAALLVACGGEAFSAAEEQDGGTSVSEVTSSEPTSTETTPTATTPTVSITINNDVGHTSAPEASSPSTPDGGGVDEDPEPPEGREPEEDPPGVSVDSEADPVEYPEPLVSGRWFPPSPEESTAEEIEPGVWHVQVSAWDGTGRSDAAASFGGGSYKYDGFVFYACGWAGGALRAEVMSQATISEGQNQHFGTDFEPTETWTEYRIYWEDLTPHPDSTLSELDRDTVQWVGLRLLDGTWYDLWLSDVQFLKRGQPYEGTVPSGKCPQG